MMGVTLGHLPTKQYRGEKLGGTQLQLKFGGMLLFYFPFWFHRLSRNIILNRNSIKYSELRDAEYSI